MEQNTNRMWWTIGLIVLGGLLISGLVMVANANVMPKISEKANTLIKTTDPDVTHTAYAWSSDGTDRFTTTKPRLNLLGGTSQSLSIQGRNYNNQCGVETNQRYYFANGKNLFQQNIGTNNKVTVSFDWKATNPTSGRFRLQFNDQPWSTTVLWNTLIDVTPTNSSGHVEATFPSPDYENMSGAVATGIEPRLDYVPENTTITISNLKYEIGQPKYIGTYTDKSKTDSQDPKKYTWKLNPEYHE